MSDADSPWLQLAAQLPATVGVACPYPECGSKKDYSLDLANHSVVCSACGKSFRVPEARSRHSSDYPIAIGVAPPGPDERMPEQINRYQVRQLLGQGAFGRVYLA